VARVRFEPIGEEIECGPEETVLDAAFRQGYNLVYGCREGQCSACKCFLLEGDVALKRYSNFALSDTERTNGYALMCRAMPEDDLVVELLHYDPDNYRLEHAIADGVAVVETVESLTHDITRLVLRADGFEFTPGQYVDLHVDGERRSFSMADIEAGQIELIIKRYPGGRFSGKLDGELKPGDEIGYTGPYGSLRARESDRPILMIAGGSGMAPILSLLREFARQGCERPIRFFYGARTDADLFYGDVAAGLAEFTPVTGRFVHEAVDEYLTGTGEQPDVYMCGPPPMVEAAEAMLARHGIDERRIFVDKFTTSAEAAADATVAVPPVKTFEAAAVAPTADDAMRNFDWYTPAKRRATLYEDVTVDTQPSVHRHLNRGWPVSFEDGRGTWDDASTALQSTDWFAFRDPGEYWERPYYQRETAIEQQIDGAMQSAVEQGLIDDFSPEWVAFLRARLQVPAYVEHGLWFALATIGRSCLSDSVATCVCLQAAMKQRSAQALVLYAMDLEQHHGAFPIAAAREAFLSDPVWQPTRRYLERLAATPDWGEVIVAANLCFEPVVGTLLRRELGIRAAAANGDTVTPVLARVAMQEWEWAQAWSTELVRFLSGDAAHGDHNRAVIERWVADWEPLANEAALALAPLAEQIPRGIDTRSAVERVRAYAERVHAQTDVRRSKAEAKVGAPARVPRRRTRPSNITAPAAATIDDGSFDYVGIVMAKSAEGDAVAEILGRRDGIEVLEQPAFWDIRSRGRLSIPYEEVSEQLGYEIDAYSIQHEMSTHYGRMVATDDALMLFSDPTEAMQYLMA
jgi:NAD(P)H-flavin reductase/ferredoxin